MVISHVSLLNAGQAELKNAQNSALKDSKQKTTLMRYKKPHTKSRCSIKIEVDTLGRHKVLRKGLEGLGGSKNVETGISLSIEYGSEYGSINDTSIKLGIGTTYQIPRSLKNFEGDFNFIPIYSLIKICSVTNEPTTYLIGQLGYNVLYEGESDYKGELSLRGGIYYGIGVGLILNHNFQIEALYSINKGEGDYSGGTVEHYDSDYGWIYSYVSPMSFDIGYSKISLSIGFRI